MDGKYCRDRTLANGSISVTNMSASIAKGFLEKFVVRANDVIFFKLIRNETDLAEDTEKNAFKPEFTHQFFGEGESIFGYRGLVVKLFYCASSLTRFISLSYDEKISSSASGGVEPDDVLKIITEKLEGNYLTNIDKFSQAVANDSKFVPFGEKIHGLTITEKGTNVEREFEVYKADISVDGFKDYHDRIRTFLLWFIDG